MRREEKQGVLHRRSVECCGAEESPCKMVIWFASNENQPKQDFDTGQVMSWQLDFSSYFFFLSFILILNVYLFTTGSQTIPFMERKMESLAREI